MPPSIWSVSLWRDTFIKITPLLFLRPHFSKRSLTRPSRSTCVFPPSIMYVCGFNKPARLPSILARNLPAFICSWCPLRTNPLVARASRTLCCRRRAPLIKSTSERPDTTCQSCPTAPECLCAIPSISTHSTRSERAGPRRKWSSPSSQRAFSKSSAQPRPRHRRLSPRICPRSHSREA